MISTSLISLIRCTLRVLQFVVSIGDIRYKWVSMSLEIAHFINQNAFAGRRRPKELKEKYSFLSEKVSVSLFFLPKTKQIFKSLKVYNLLCFFSLSLALVLSRTAGTLKTSKKMFLSVDNSGQSPR